MNISVNKGTEKESVEIDDHNILSVLSPAGMPSGLDAKKILLDALKHPVQSPPVSSLLHAGETAAVVISDMTRPVPSGVLLQVLLPEILSCGIRKEDITILIARGSHRPMSKEEIISLVGHDIFNAFPIRNSGENGYVYCGTTSRGTPVRIDRNAVLADHLILTGNVEFHYFAGFSGGAKAVMPGLADPDIIACNHRLMTDEHARSGEIEGNPVREDIEEAAALTGADFILNVVLNTRREIIAAYAGDMTGAHRAACHLLKEEYLSPIPQLADVVIVSQGGAPKDLNLYQTQKALANAAHAVKDGGTIILVGSCQEGYGNPVFEEWMKKYRQPDEMLQQLHDHFILGGHKAAAIASVRKRADILLVSDMKEEDVSGTFLKPFRTLKDAWNDAVLTQGEDASVIVMPYGGSTLPAVRR